MRCSSSAQSRSSSRSWSRSSCRPCRCWRRRRGRGRSWARDHRSPRAKKRSKRKPESWSRRKPLKRPDATPIHCAGSGELKTLASQLIGTWQLLSREDRTAAGERRIDPGLGGDPVALLVYDAAGNFAAQFMKRDRSSDAVAVTGRAGVNNSSAVNGYDAYFGSYTVDEASGSVTQVLHGALSRGDVGKVVTREMQ